MDKITLNKQIVLLRKEVERAKVRVINKLTRDVKSLKVAKSWHTDQHKEKNLKKVERFIAELSLIKKANKDDVSKLALTSTKKSLDALRADPNNPVERKALARLAAHPQLNASVEKFRSQFPDWESTLPPIVDSLGVKVKHRKRNQVPTLATSTAETEEDDSSTKADGGNVSEKTVAEKLPKGEILEASIEKIPVTVSSRKKKGDKTIKKILIAPTAGGVWEVEDECEKTSEGRSDAKSSRLKGQADGKIKVVVAKKNKERADTKLDEAIKLSGKSNLSVNKSKTSVTKSKSTKVMRFSELMEIETKAIKSSVKYLDEKPPAISEPKAVDSFFVSEDGETEYLSVVSATEPVEKRDESQLHKYAKLREKYLNEFGRIPNRKELRLRERQKFSSSFSSFTHEPPSSKHQLESKRTKGDVAAPKSQLNRPIHSKPAEVEGPVHPSWEAKRKAKEMLSTTFQGKKIKFDD